MSSRTKNGFTLIELLASMAVLSLIVLLVGRIMADGTAAYKAGTTRAEMNDSGRAIFDFIVQDISSAIAYSNDNVVVVFNVEDPYSIPNAPAGEIYGRPSSQLRFVSLNNEPTLTTRGVKEVIYRIREMDRNGAVPDRYQLMRSELKNLSAPGEVSCYTAPNWWEVGGNNDSEFEVVAENVAHFAVYAYATNYNGISLSGITDVIRNVPQVNPPYSFESSLHEGGSLPLFVDVYMELLSEKDAILVAATQDDVRARKLARRYQARIYFKNRRGYSG